MVFYLQNDVTHHNWFNSLGARALWSCQENVDRGVVVEGGGGVGQVFYCSNAK